MSPQESINFSLFQEINSHLKNRFPYDWKTPNRYMMTILFQAVVVLCNVEIYMTVLILFFGFCHFLTAFITQIELDLKHLNEAVVNKPTMRKFMELKSDLILIIQFHANAKRLSHIHTHSTTTINNSFHFRFAHRYSETYKKVIMTCLSFASVFICTSLLQIHVVNASQNGKQLNQN